MEQTGRAFLRWTLAIIVLAGVCVYAVNNVGAAFRAGVAFGGDASPSPSPGTGPVASGESNPDFDYALLNNVVGFLTTDGMNVGPGAADGLVLQFPLIEGDPECVATASIEIPVRSATFPTQFALFPGGASVTGDPVDGAPLPEPISINLNAPALGDTDGTRPLSWDVAGLYRTWATQGTYDGGPAPAEGTDFTVVVRPTGGDQPGRVVIFASTEAPDLKPRLIWTGAEGCGTA